MPSVCIASRISWNQAQDEVVPDVVSSTGKIVERRHLERIVEVPVRIEATDRPALDLKVDLPAA
jgi:hypothetical protein